MIPVYESRAASLGKVVAHMMQPDVIPNPTPLFWDSY